MTTRETHDHDGNTQAILSRTAVLFQARKFHRWIHHFVTQSVMAISLMGIPIGSGWYSIEFDLMQLSQRVYLHTKYVLEIHTILANKISCTSVIKVMYPCTSAHPVDTALLHTTQPPQVPSWSKSQAPSRGCLGAPLFKVVYIGEPVVVALHCGSVPCSATHTTPTGPFLIHKAKPPLEALRVPLPSRWYI